MGYLFNPIIYYALNVGEYLLLAASNYLLTQQTLCVDLEVNLIPARKPTKTTLKLWFSADSSREDCKKLHQYSSCNF